MTTVAELPAGFADKVLSAQSTFRSVMEAMARPGSVHRITATSGTPAAMMRGTAAIALTLFDHDTPIWLDPLLSETSEIAKWRQRNPYTDELGPSRPVTHCYKTLF